MICFFIGHKYHMQDIGGFTFRWCSRCGQSHTLDKIVNFGAITRLEWSPVIVKPFKGK